MKTLYNKNYIRVMATPKKLILEVRDNSRHSYERLNKFTVKYNKEAQEFYLSDIQEA